MKSDRSGQPHQRRASIASAILAVCLVWHASISQAQTLERFEFREPHLGTIVAITLYAPDESVANDCARAAFARIKELNGILSDYDPESEAMRLCRTAGSGQSVPVSAELFEVLTKSLEFAHATNGDFDVSIGPVIKLWRTSRRLKKLPTAAELASARQRVGWQQIRLDPKGRTVELQTKGMQLDFGGIAKGYIADQARAVLVKRNLRKCLVSVAGDISAGDAPPDRDGWRVGIAPLDKPDGEPVRYLRLANCSVSTAGDAFQFVTINGIRYSHIVDPATGVGLTQRISVTVVAPEGIVADGLDTAACIMGPERGLKLIEQTHGAVGMIMLATDDGVTVTESNGFSKYVIP
jgi:thiamine biosynthesis lipoprotein